MSTTPNSSRADDVPPYDRAHLATFTGGDVVLERVLLRQFCLNADVQLAELSAASSFDDWQASAHKLKGGARGIGAWPIARLCERAESLSGFDAGRCRPIVLQLRRELDKLCDAIS